MSSAAFRMWSSRSGRTCSQANPTCRVGPSALEAFWRRRCRTCFQGDQFRGQPSRQARRVLGSDRRTSYSERELLPVQVQVGYELVFRCQQSTPMVVTLSIHYSRVSDLIKADHLVLTPSIPVTAYRDSFGNWCSRIVAPPGQLRLSSDAVVSDTGNPDLVAPWLEQRPVEALPEETLLFLLGSRYCGPTCCLRLHGAYSMRRRLAGSASRPSAISCINTFSSATAFRAQRSPLFKFFRIARACVATLPISPSRSAVA